jgi:hypothetical protein
VPDLLACLGGVKVGKVVVREPTLEDAYVRLVGGDGDGAKPTPEAAPAPVAQDVAQEVTA